MPVDSHSTFKRERRSHAGRIQTTGFPLGETRGGVENPVENVDNRAGFPPRAAVILGDYVYQKLPLVVARKECRTVTSP